VKPSKQLKTLFALGTGLWTIGVSFATSAHGIPYQGQTLYRVGNNEIYISGTANGTAEVLLPRTTTRAATANACGVVVVRGSTSSPLNGTITAGSSSADFATLPTNTIPSCNSTTGQLAEPRTANFKTAEGAAVFVGQTPLSAVSVSFPSASTRRLTLNACGFNRIRASATTPLPTTFTYGGQQYTVSSLPDAGQPPLCRRDSATNTSIPYRPLAWQ
jgi:hypothetical protein